MPRQPAPVTVPIASYIGQRIRLPAICDDCLNVAAAQSRDEAGERRDLYRRVHALMRRNPDSSATSARGTPQNTQGS